MRSSYPTDLTDEQWQLLLTLLPGAKPSGRPRSVDVRAVDSAGNTLDFMLSAKRDGKAAARFFRKVLKAQHTQTPRVINVNKNSAYPVAMETLKGDETLDEVTELWQVKYLNNGVEQDHRNIKRIIRVMMEFRSVVREKLEGN
ncbi:DDE-type integrase/transposase/recombinase [Oculatella sp. LEGE 06141]|uniref:DDE-type integrase/transposase/recombinase n=1 Tax=Oculatella sp. LEGE 06141 TaxID=1828648 RepID=UPI00187FAC0D|nr:DDE-type integrase/transposase/recombinase [Oculatella sp. LEGE 06141]MBE9182943.1 DDE-type integrase/transposase/recombinase [Oculatella sp. LEGE 06141]